MRLDTDTAARTGQRCRQRVSPTRCWTAAAAARPLRGQQAAGSTGALLGSGCFESETHEPGQHFGQHLEERQPVAGRARPEAPALVAGTRFGRLTAIESAGRDCRSRLRWVFACDCGRRVTRTVATVTYNVRRLGWCACGDCYAAAGGWRSIARRSA